MPLFNQTIQLEQANIEISLIVDKNGLVNIEMPHKGSTQSLIKTRKFCLSTENIAAITEKSIKQRESQKAHAKLVEHKNELETKCYSLLKKTSEDEIKLEINKVRDLLKTNKLTEFDTLSGILVGLEKKISQTPEERKCSDLEERLCKPTFIRWPDNYAISISEIKNQLLSRNKDFDRAKLAEIEASITTYEMMNKKIANLLDKLNVMTSSRYNPDLYALQASFMEYLCRIAYISDLSIANKLDEFEGKISKYEFDASSKHFVDPLFVRSNDLMKRVFQYKNQFSEDKLKEIRSFFKSDFDRTKFEQKLEIVGNSVRDYERFFTEVADGEKLIIIFEKALTLSEELKISKDDYDLIAQAAMRQNESYNNYNQLDKSVLSILNKYENVLANEPTFLELKRLCQNL